MRRSSFETLLYGYLLVRYISKSPMNGPRPRGSIFSTFHKNVRNALPIEKSERRRDCGKAASEHLSR